MTPVQDPVFKSASPRSPARVWRLLALALIVAVAAATIIVPGHRGLLDLSPHPLLILVIVLAAAHGNPAAHLYGAVGAGCMAALVLIHAAGGPTSPVWAVAQVAGVALAASFVGAVRSESLNRLRSAHGKSGLVAGLLQSTHARKEGGGQEATQLEGRVRAHEGALAGFWEAATRLQTLEPAALYPAIADTVAQLLGVERVAVYVPASDGRFLLRAGFPRDLPGRPPVLVGPGNGAAECYLARRVMAFTDPLPTARSAAPAPNTAELVGPLVGTRGDVMAVVIVEGLRVSEFSTATSECFEQLLAWSARALENAGEHAATVNRLLTRAGGRPAARGTA